MTNNESTKNKIIILKIGSFMRPEGDASSIGLITSEPMNFAKVLVDRVGHKYDVMLASDRHILDVDNQLTYLNIQKDGRYFAANEFGPGDIVLIWQGVYLDQEHHPHITAHYEFINELQKRSNSKDITQYFMLTDTRVPLLNIVDFVKHKFTPGEFESKYLDEHAEDFLTDTSRFDIDTTQITMLTQASATQLLQYDLYNGSIECGCGYNGFEYRFYKDVKHFSMYTMPLLTHGIDKSWQYFNSHNVPKHDMIFTVQSIGYFNGYRMSRFLELVANPAIVANHDVAVYGKHNRKSLNVLFDYVESRDTTGHGTIQLPKLLGPVKFSEMKYVISEATYNMCISEGPYVKYDLLPNRIFESFAAGCIPLIDADIIKNTTNFALLSLADRHPKFVVANSDDVLNALENLPNTRELSDFRLDVDALKQSTITKFYEELSLLF